MPSQNGQRIFLIGENMSNSNILEHFLHNVFRPIGDFFYNLFNHPADTVTNAVSGAADWIQDHPYTTVAVVGLGMYATHRGWLKFHKRGMHVDVDAQCCLGEVHVHNSFRIGRK